MTTTDPATDIVRELALTDPTFHDTEDGIFCTFCDGRVWPAPMSVDRHKPTCLWRRPSEFITKCDCGWDDIEARLTREDTDQ